MLYACRGRTYMSQGQTQDSSWYVSEAASHFPVPLITGTRCTCTHTHSCTHMYSHIHVYTCIHVLTHAHAHAHTLSLSQDPQVKHIWAQGIIWLRGEPTCHSHGNIKKTRLLSSGWKLLAELQACAERSSPVVWNSLQFIHSAFSRAWLSREDKLFKADFVPLGRKNCCILRLPNKRRPGLRHLLLSP